MQNKSSVLAIGDTHFPFCRRDYLDFCLDTSRRFKCNKFVHVGDVVDLHSVSYHEHNPNGMSPKDEIEAAKKEIKKWGKAFPRMDICKGNHDILFDRLAITHGIPDVAIRKYSEIFDLPVGWDFQWRHYINGVTYEHGTGYSGKSAHIQAATANRCSTVIGHVHATGGVDFLANDTSIIFGMATGSGIDRMKYAFWYGKDFKNKPVISCGVVIDGREAFVVPMKI